MMKPIIKLLRKLLAVNIFGVYAVSIICSISDSDITDELSVCVRRSINWLDISFKLIKKSVLIHCT